MAADTRGSYYPNGQVISDVWGTYFYPNGAKVKDTWGSYYPNGQEIQNTWGTYYPNAQETKDTWGVYYHNGQVVKDTWGCYYSNGLKYEPCLEIVLARMRIGAEIKMTYELNTNSGEISNFRFEEQAADAPYSMSYDVDIFAGKVTNVDAICD